MPGDRCLYVRSSVDELFEFASSSGQWHVPILGNLTGIVDQSVHRALTAGAKLLFALQIRVVLVLNTPAQKKLSSPFLRSLTTLTCKLLCSRFRKIDRLGPFRGRRFPIAGGMLGSPRRFRTGRFEAPLGAEVTLPPIVVRHLRIARLGLVHESVVTGLDLRRKDHPLVSPAPVPAHQTAHNNQ
ncbi:hypothetical protein AAT18_09550 [Rhodococcus aetherivorans]|nr:hypothetical protein AAT18_09550 [Rhodococcus aetherivorans]